MLRQEQIQEIDAILINQYDLQFDAFRHEIVDHIACEIEEHLVQEITFDKALTLVLKKWHFELKPVIGKKGVPTCLVKQLYKKDSISYLIMVLFFIISWFSESYSFIELTTNPWVSFGCILAGFIVSIGMQKRFFNPVNYEMMFYMNALSGLMLFNIIILTLAMLNIRPDFEQVFVLSSFHIFVLTFYILILNLFFVGKASQQYKQIKNQSTLV